MFFLRLFYLECVRISNSLCYLQGVWQAFPGTPFAVLLGGVVGDSCVARLFLWLVGPFQYIK